MQFTGGQPQVLSQSKVARVKFNPKSKKHLDSLKMFLETGRWGDVQFQVEAPYVSVPHMVLTKFAMDRLRISTPDVSQEEPTAKVRVETPEIVDPVVDGVKLDLELEDETPAPDVVNQMFGTSALRGFLTRVK
jgi:hypothetical protein